MNLKHLEALCSCSGVSGREKEVRTYLIEQIKGFAAFRIDALGNLIVEKRGKNRAENKVMVAAHMDEVGLIIPYITPEGYLRCAPIGGIDPRVVFGRRVLIGQNQTPGLIGGKPIHLLKEEERGQAPDFDSLLIDIGASGEEDARKYVRPGDVAVFDSPFVRFGDGFLKARALDDRVGCAILLDLTQAEAPYDFTAVFTVQEEVGARGALAAAFSVSPDYALVLETTTAADLSGVEGEKCVCTLGGGPVVSYMDRATIYDRAMYQVAFSLAEESGLPIQTKSMVAGGNDAGVIHQSKAGVRTLAVSMPCRYLHSSSCVIQEADGAPTQRLVELLIRRLAE